MLRLSCFILFAIAARFAISGARCEGTGWSPLYRRDQAASFTVATWKKQDSPLGGYILASPTGKPLILDNLAKRSIRPRLEAVNKEAAERGEKSELSWPSWYSLRRFHGTAVRAESNHETTSRALGNSKAVADRHYVKPSEVLPDVRKAVNDAVSGLTDVQPVFNGHVN